MNWKIYSLAVLLWSCNKGVWVAQHTYRPKHPHFRILKKPFVFNKEIDTSHWYVSTRGRFITEGRLLFVYTGLYADGRMLGTETVNHDTAFIMAQNSWSTAANIGYYTTEGTHIDFEYFAPGDGGQYVTMQGMVKRDTILLFETSGRVAFKREFRYDTLVKTTLPIRP